ncbi:unnamed protein product [Nezara viridula]|uniref:Uncharacterized protein n=1 Tax=Nezara viridula TaxID=85310 RepID=A0A9P0MYA8_NEZVI|nr:unnamed protein product [Nezara viridula]
MEPSVNKVEKKKKKKNWLCYFLYDILLTELFEKTPFPIRRSRRESGVNYRLLSSSPELLIKGRLIYHMFPPGLEITSLSYDDSFNLFPLPDPIRNINLLTFTG